jgi:hypothetical protein
VVTLNGLPDPLFPLLLPYVPETPGVSTKCSFPCLECEQLPCGPLASPSSHHYGDDTCRPRSLLVPSTVLKAPLQRKCLSSPLSAQGSSAQNGYEDSQLNPASEETFTKRPPCAWHSKGTWERAVAQQQPPCHTWSWQEQDGHEWYAENEVGSDVICSVVEALSEVRQ